MGALEEFLAVAIWDCVEARWQKLEWCPSNAEPPCLNTPGADGGACEVCVAQGFTTVEGAGEFQGSGSKVENRTGDFKATDG